MLVNHDPSEALIASMPDLRKVDVSSNCFRLADIQMSRYPVNWNVSTEFSKQGREIGLSTAITSIPSKIPGGNGLGLKGESLKLHLLQSWQRHRGTPYP